MFSPSRSGFNSRSNSRSKYKWQAASDTTNVQQLGSNSKSVDKKYCHHNHFTPQMLTRHNMTSNNSNNEAAVQNTHITLTHSLTAALDQLRVVASSTSNDPDPRSRQHQQHYLLPLAAANFSVDDPAGASSQQREECRCGLLLTVAVPAKQVCSPVGDRCVQIMNDVCQQ